jgi:hypothetical protein
MTMLTPEDYSWKRGFPPDKDTTKWEVAFTVGGAVWYRRRQSTVGECQDKPHAD